jgi:hypothetical protein
VQNHGDTVFNVSAIMGSLNNVQDFGFHIQVIVHFTRTTNPTPVRPFLCRERHLASICRWKRALAVKIL